MELKVLKIDGTESGKKVVLDEKVFGIEPNDHAIGDGEDHPALGRVVVLGQDDGGEGQHRVEGLGLSHGVLPQHGVQDEDGPKPLAPRLSLEDAVNLAELLHEIVLGVQAPRRIHDQDVGLRGTRQLRCCI